MGRTTPTILHVDMDAFFASVEILENPDLAGKPLIVGGSGDRGVVASCNYEARRFGVRSAMPSRRARRLCPQATFVHGDYSRYVHYSESMREVLNEFTPLVEPLSIDEAFLDIAGSTKLLGKPAEIATALRARLQQVTGLTACVGAANTKHLAKLASVHAKPKADASGIRHGSGVFVIEPADVFAFLHPLRVTRLWGVGPTTAAKLEQFGIDTVGALANTDFTALSSIVGAGQAQHLLDLANNDDDRVVEVEREAKSVGHEQTFVKNLDDRSEVDNYLLRLADGVASRLRAEGVAGRTVTVKVRFGDFRTITRSETRTNATSATKVIADVARRLLFDVDVSIGVRLLGISVSNFSETRDNDQLSFDLSATATRDDDAKEEIMDVVVDDIRARFGVDAVMSAGLAGSRGAGVLHKGERQWGPSLNDEKAATDDRLDQ